MEFQSYNQELVYANLQFRRLFNNISIYENGKHIKFTCLIGNRSRILKGLENPNRNNNLQLPLIIIQRNGITKNNERLSNVNNEVKYKTSKHNLDKNLYTPVPIDISYQVTIVSKYQKHIDWVLSNIIPFFNKDLFVRCEHPKFKDVEFTNQVIMEDSIEENHPDDVDSSSDDLIECVCNFTYKTYMFCGNKKADAERYTIQKISVYLSVDEETHISTEISTIIDVEYDGFIPTINTINIGFYPVPLLSDYYGYMQFADSIPDDKLPISSYISTDLSGNDIYLSVTTSAEYYPYVDRFSWKIDEGKFIG